jgi:DNA-binding NarL/FixJ family response regulator
MIRIVLADDHAMFRQGLINLLSGVADIEIAAQCSNGVEAIAAIAAHRPDVAVLDVTMPGIDGLTATRRIKRDHPAIKVVILTMHDDPIVRQQAATAGAHAFVLKDDAFEQLLATIRAVAASNEIMPFTALMPNHLEAVITERETQVMRLVASGLTNRAISEQLGISIKTVDSHRTNLMRKLNLHSTADLVRHAIATGVI